MQPPDCMQRTQSSLPAPAAGKAGEPLLDPPAEPEPEPNRSDLPCRLSMYFNDFSSVHGQLQLKSSPW